MICKEKTKEEKYRAIKRPFLPFDARRQLKLTANGEIDRSEQNTLLQHEASMLRHETFFKVKPVITSTGDSSPALIMRMAKGKELSKVCAKFSFPQSIVAAIQLGERIEKLHAQNIIHGDIKPENVIVDRNENKDPKQSVLADFEIALQINDPKIYDLAGTPGFIAPELYESECGASFASDTYSFTVVLNNFLFRYREDWLRKKLISEQHKELIDEMCNLGLQRNPAQRASLSHIMMILRGIHEALLEMKLAEKTGLQRRYC